MKVYKTFLIRAQLDWDDPVEFQMVTPRWEDPADLYRTAWRKAILRLKPVADQSIWLISVKITAPVDVDDDE